MCVGRTEHELFLADNWNKVVRSFDTQAGRLGVTDVYNTKGHWVQDVAYNNESGTLFIATSEEPLKITVRSFGQTGRNDVWSERDQRSLEVQKEYTKDTYLRVLRNGSHLALLCGQRNNDFVHVCHMQTSHRFHECRRVTFAVLHYGFDVQLVGGEAHVAAAHFSSATIWRLGSENDLQQLTSISIDTSAPPLFMGHTLLVRTWNRSMLTSGEQNSALISFSTVRRKLQRTELELFPREQNKLLFTSWCFANDTLFAWNPDSDSLLLFKAN